MPNHRKLLGGLAAITLSVALAGCGGSGFEDEPDPAGTGGTGDTGDSETTAAADPAAGGPISVLIGSSGDAETKAVQDAVAAWADENGAEAEVIVASDLIQQASQGFASGDPADVLYVSTDSFTGWAENGSLLAYADDLSNADDFYPGLREAFTYDDQFYCAPKDFSTLALVINETLWADAGLTDDDVPTTWDQLSEVAATLTTDGRVGLAFGPEIQRVGVFLAQAGGGLVTDGQATANSEQNVAALTYVQEQMNEGTFAYSSDLGAGWGGEAFGKELAAMAIEGNWITGALTNDFPDISYKVVELPAGEQQGTLQYTNCWGIAADGDNIEGSKSLVEFLTTKEQQLAFSEAFGPMPSIESAREDWSAANPELEAFVLGADYAQNLPAMPGAADVIGEINAQISQLKTADPQTLLDGIQPLLESIIVS